MTIKLNLNEQEYKGIKIYLNIDFVFRKAFCQKKFMYAGININPYDWR